MRTITKHFINGDFVESTDVGDRKRTEEALRQSPGRSRAHQPRGNHGRHPEFGGQVFRTAHSRVGC